MSAILWLVAAVSQAAGAIGLASFMIFLVGFFFAMCVFSCFFAHVAETNPDITLGIVAVSGALWQLIAVAFANPILNYLGPAALFLLSGLVCIGGAIYVQFIIKEAKGLNDLQCKRLYWDEKYQDIRESEIKSRDTSSYA